jgi:hypothetical protein
MLIKVTFFFSLKSTLYSGFIWQIDQGADFLRIFVGDNQEFVKDQEP